MIKQTEEFQNILKPLTTKIDEMNILLKEIHNEIYKKSKQQILKNICYIISHIIITIKYIDM